MATSPTPAPQGASTPSALAQYLSIAPTKPYAITGTIPSNVSNGSAGQVTWQQQLPIVPANCVAVTYEVTLPVTLTLPATTGTATLSPFAPYSALANQMTLGGAPPWNMTEFTPWYLDVLTRLIDRDPAYNGLANGYDMSWFGASGVLDQGPQGISIPLAPGTTVTNTTTAAVSTNYTFVFRITQLLQRRRNQMWGAVPFGDPMNRPNNLVQLTNLLGINPESCLFVAGDEGATCVTNGQPSVTAVYHLSYIDLLPQGVSAPQPNVVLGLQLTANTTSGLTPGNIVPIAHRTAQIYQAIHHILVNDQLPVRTDYFGLWDDQDEQSARWAYDASRNTLQQYFTDFHDVYGRYPFAGHYQVDMVGGKFPYLPSVTPYQAAMSSDANYAQLANVVVTPAMSTALRLPAATTPANPYIKNYSFGLVKVPY